jgi:DNA invertase Pin-like site-specific DNA recombinase
MDEEVKPKVGGFYGRDSLKKQDTIDLQISKSLEWAGIKGIDIPKDFIWTEKKSGKSIKHRVEFAKMMDAARQHKFDVLFIYKISRAFRNMRDAVFTLDELRRLGVELVSVSEGIDTTTSIGRFIYNIMASLAEMERENISEWTGETLNYKLESGINISNPSYGYRRSYGKSKHGFGGLTKHIAESVIVADIFKRFIENEKEISILKKDYNMTFDKLIIILTNPIYCGYKLYKGEFIKLPFPTIISIEDFIKANTKLSDSKVAQRRWKIDKFITRFIASTQEQTSAGLGLQEAGV